MLSHRISSIDFFRVVAILAVICRHTTPFMGNQFNDTPYGVLGILINQGDLFAIPFFFIASGFFFGKKIHSGVSPRIVCSSYSKRLLTIFIFWSFIYMVMPTDIPELLQYGFLKTTYWKIYSLFTHPITLIFQGAKVHLWFLVSLVCALWLITLLINNGFQKKIIFLSAILYVLGLMARSYSDTPFGLNNIQFDTRNGPFISTLFVAIGYYYSSNDFRFKPGVAITLIIIGLVLHMTEVFILWNFFNIAPPTPRYLLGTVIFNAGIMLLLLAKPNFAMSSPLPKIGKYTLGVYTSHQLFVDILKPLGGYFNSFFWEISCPVIVYALALLLTFLFTQNRLLRGVVI